MFDGKGRDQVSTDRVAGKAAYRLSRMEIRLAGKTRAFSGQLERTPEETSE